MSLFPLSGSACRSVAHEVLPCLVQTFRLDSNYHTAMQTRLSNIQFAFQDDPELSLHSNGKFLGSVPVPQSRPSHLILCPPLVLQDDITWIDPVIYLSTPKNPADRLSVLVHELIHFFSFDWIILRGSPELVLQNLLGISRTTYIYRGTHPPPPVFDTSINTANEILTDRFAEMVFDVLFHHPYAFAHRHCQHPLSKHLSTLAKEDLVTDGNAYFRNDDGFIEAWSHPAGQAPQGADPPGRSPPARTRPGTPGQR